MALHSVKRTRPIINRIKLFLVNTPNISSNWVKAHIGIEGNELAGSIAKSATMKDDIDYNAKIPKSWIKHQLKVFATERWQQRWDMSLKAWFLFGMMPVVL
ncbi:hypothetical protein AVEN_195353-1 [Araneus ventricosus]|uniref:RNase H type-1 domain-containing protein n=1 Tax=Araneus ventricosus TaxID=182803 RepID=A0A4Y2DJ51_ARAVE|nr:hypothetical protein AVEN_195353-1 [Araneus ventricosus]